MSFTGSYTEDEPDFPYVGKSFMDVTVRAFSTLFLVSFVVSKHRQAGLICLTKFFQHDNGNLDDFKIFRGNSSQGMSQNTRCCAKKKTKAVENYRPSSRCRIGFKSKFSSYLFYRACDGSTRMLQ